MSAAHRGENRRGNNLLKSPLWRAWRIPRSGIAAMCIRWHRASLRAAAHQAACGNACSAAAANRARLLSINGINCVIAHGGVHRQQRGKMDLAHRRCMAIGVSCAYLTHTCGGAHRRSITRGAWQLAWRRQRRRRAAAGEMAARRHQNGVIGISGEISAARLWRRRRHRSAAAGASAQSIGGALSSSKRRRRRRRRDDNRQNNRAAITRGIVNLINKPVALAHRAAYRHLASRNR